MFYFAINKQRLYGFARLRHQDQIGCLTIPSSFALLPWHLAFSLLGFYACASVCKCFSPGESGVGGGGRQLTSEALEWWCLKVCCVYSCIQFSVQGDSVVALTLLAVQQWRVGVCLCVFSVHSATSHLRLLSAHWLGAGLRRLVALEVLFPNLLWSFSPQNNLLNTEAEEQMEEWKIRDYRSQYCDNNYYWQTYNRLIYMKFVKNMNKAIGQVEVCYLLFEVSSVLFIH